MSEGVIESIGVSKMNCDVYAEAMLHNYKSYYNR
jgi:hypothetical protein